MFRLFAIMLSLFLLCAHAPTPSISEAWAHSFDGTIKRMVQTQASLKTVHSKDTGHGIIAIGYGMHNSPNKAREIARLDALRTMGAYLNGERVSGVESLEMSFNGNEASESFYSRIVSNVEASLKSVELLASGEQKGQVWVAMALTEQSHVSHGMLAQREASNEVQARGGASLRSGPIKARQLALQEALRNAVEQYNGVQTAARSSVENQETVRSGIATVSKGTVETYVIVKEFAENNVYYIDILAKIANDEGIVSNDAIKESFGRPSFYIKCDDVIIKDMVAKVLSKNNFITADAHDTARYIMKLEAFRERYDVPIDKKMQGMRTELVIAVYDMQNRQDALFTVTNNPSESVEISANITLLERNSSRFAIESIEEELVGSLNAMFNQQFNNGTKVRISLSGFQGMRQVEEFRQCLLALPHTKDAQVMPVQGRSVDFELIYRGPSQSLQIEIMKKAREYSLPGLRAKESAGGKLAFTF